MTRLFLVPVAITMATGTVTAQINYYSDYPNQVTISTEDGLVTYKYNEYLELYNSNNKFTGVRNAFTDGSKESLIRDQYDCDQDQMYIVNKIVYENLTEEQRQMMKDKYLSTRFYFDSQTGRVVDVVFVLVDKAPRCLPPEFYYKVEKECKKVLSITPNEFGRRLNYIFIGFGFEVNHPSEFVRRY